ncbi:hypothetical protein GDO78_001666 [Eleutherodactylus coqui]|uniref:Uncharacterized protein n=1 Tax=Eleutherodactylus coqui TaxID=57060 RepID=A0A8J6FW54_ELECQ|nr:hypothetical protein GDO78_001666 [Eleutherodactylus coqui]
MEDANVKTEKLLTKYGSFHPKSNTQRLYTNRIEDGRCLMRVKAIILNETRNIQQYISKMAPKYELLRECLRLQQKTWKLEQMEEGP